MEPRIEVSRPFTLILIIGAVVYGLSFLMTESSGQTANVSGQGGEASTQLAIHTAEDDMRRLRLESELAERHIEVLKYQLSRLEDERNVMREDLSEEENEQFRQGLRQLVELIEGKRRADEKMIETFRQLWEADRAALASAAISEENPNITISWPVEPIYGISAVFEDSDYQKFFGIPHKAVDIPALQSTPVLAADDGVVEEVVDNGMGYNYVILRHHGYATLYGHISAFHVAVGDSVRQGDPIGLSGGMPNTPGAGNLTTGPHLHFELITGKGHINPLLYLPSKGATLRE